MPDKAIIHHRLAGGNWQQSEIDLKRETNYSFSGGDSVAFSMRIRQINKSFDYYIEAGRVKTEIQKIDVVDRPRVNGIKLSLFYPDYTETPPQVIDENNGSFSAIVGSRVNMKITTNLPVTQAELVFEDSSRTPLKVNNKTAEGSLIIDKSHAYYIHLTNHLSEHNPDPIEYYITALPDEYPSIDVLRPGFDVNLNDEMLLPIKVRIFDDYGFSSLVLKYRIVSHGRASDENVAVLHFSDRIKTEGEVEFNWDMDQFHLYPGDYLAYYFEVADNDKITGPKISKSRTYIARLPSLDEIIADTEARSAQRINKTEQILKTGKELAKRLQNASRKLQSELKNSKTADWQNQKELGNIADKNAKMVDEIEKMAQQMDKSIQELSDKTLMSRDILEKLAQIQKLFEEVATPEMKEAQRKLMEAMKNMDPNQLEDAMKNFEMSQKELLERLERTLALLKKIQLEQKMEAMLRQVEELVKRQEGMNEKTEASKKKDLPDLSPKEDEIKDALEKLKKETDKLDDIAKQAKMEKSPELNKFKQALKETDADQNMKQMSDAMKEEDKENSSSEGDKALSKLMQMLDSMQQQLATMKGEQDEKLKRDMRMAQEDSNYLSRNQEELLKRAAELKASNDAFNDLAAEQQDLKRACQGLKNRISEIGKQSPFIGAELNQILNNSLQSMDYASDMFGENSISSGMMSQQNAMVEMNKASIRLRESLKQQKKCNSGANCNKNTSMMQSLCDKQSQLNKETQSQCSNPGSNPKPGQQGQGRESLKRLAAEQGSIRKSLEQLNREFGGSRQILGRLDDIAQEMKKVEESLENGETGSKVTERQLKIFSRMLEASRSLYRKDFSQQRQAKTAGENLIYIPPELANDILNSPLKLEDRLKKYLGDDYPKQYEEQIKAYFKALLQAETNQNIQPSEN